MTRTFTNIGWNFIAKCPDLPQSSPREVDTAKDFDNHCNRNTHACAKDKDLYTRGFAKYDNRAYMNMIHCHCMSAFV